MYFSRGSAGHRPSAGHDLGPTKLCIFEGVLLDIGLLLDHGLMASFFLWKHPWRFLSKANVSVKF